MIKDKKPIKVMEKYIIEENDTLEIKSNGVITEIFINGNKIKFITEVKFTQKVNKKPVVEIKRLFNPKDFEEIKKIY